MQTAPLPWSYFYIWPFRLAIKLSLGICCLIPIGVVVVLPLAMALLVSPYAISALATA